MWCPAGRPFLAVVTAGGQRHGALSLSADLVGTRSAVSGKLGYALASFIHFGTIDCNPCGDLQRAVEDLVHDAVGFASNAVVTGVE